MDTRPRTTSRWINQNQRYRKSCWPISPKPMAETLRKPPKGIHPRSAALRPWVTLSLRDDSNRLNVSMTKELEHASNCLEGIYKLRIGFLPCALVFSRTSGGGSLPYAP